ncbi:conserved hypothetical protein [Neospora caninum Liverpool]|uniref:Uncharacterized protein n=1 Tax=Neospora caninum (strain Liverpool) TaxID=572307 RepID=F0VAZ5_NEOCL|nr:conserved hypothetical protein [Neospora caninum Liverpool]CBZ51371.1 conserved hypothetical protein [Neospora caninum Liverpool]CEL68690.1 TPA: hypothetical protein BN1204_044330 [Neospora caninum Liverpool]|eukprot:XP_003881404.1 conserved hypothetical protein [Neospora caninum Liverpool]
MTDFFSCFPSAFCGLRRRLRHKGEKNDQISIQGTVTMVHDSSSPISIASPSPTQKMFCSLHQKFSPVLPRRKRRIPVLPSLASSAYSTCCDGQNSSPLIACSETGDGNSETPILQNRPAIGPGESQLSSALQVTLSSQHKLKSDRIAFSSDLESFLSSRTPPRANVAEKSDFNTKEFHGVRQSTPVGFPQSKQLPHPPLEHISGEKMRPRRNTAVGVVFQPCLYSPEEKEEMIRGFTGWEEDKTAWCNRRRNATTNRQTLPKVRCRRLPDTKARMDPSPAITLLDDGHFIFIGNRNTVAGDDTHAPRAQDTTVQQMPSTPADAARATLRFDRFSFRRGMHKNRLQKTARLENHFEDKERNGKQEAFRPPFSDREIDDEFFNLGDGLKVGDEDLLFLSDMTAYIDCRFVDD